MEKCRVSDKSYWNKFYEKKIAPVDASDFAKYTMKNFLKKGHRIVDLGCGNGRDSLFFKKEGLSVVAVDSSQSAIQILLQNNQEDNICFVCDDFTTSEIVYKQEYEYCYSRFTIHAISEQQESELIHNVYRALKQGEGIGYFFIEVRSVLDDIYGLGECVGEDEYIYEGHYRRFIRKNKLEKSLKDAGFKIISSLEECGFAKFNDSDPVVIRIIAQK